MAGGFGTRTNGGGAGGSGWVFTEANYDAGYTSSTYTGGTWLLNSTYYLTEAETKVGNDSTIPNYDGSNTMTSNTGDGYARITYISK